MSAAKDLRARVEAVLEAAGLRHRVVGGLFLSEMRRSLLELLERGILPATIYDEYLQGPWISSPQMMGEVQSVILVAAPSPPLQVAFTCPDRRLEVIIPPTYVSSQIRRRETAVLSTVLEPAGYSLQRAALPAKLLAARVGLAEYGRNGLVYVEGWGSYVRLDAFVTDAPLVDQEDPAVAGVLLERLSVPPRMRRCFTCSWCYRACPTACIDEGGDRIDPLRCLTYINEHEGPWPEWLDGRAHNCLVGCMICQSSCRANVEKGYVLAPIPAGNFSAEETAIILENRPKGMLPDALRAKLDELDLTDYSTVLGRNLRALAGL